ncbi:unnamed protein product [Adineta steineri]|uniref:Endonuclease/exonuclease/phosphatase domain-containing protein n=1 Tax=Adineta steineri TaxID=433720 RepID=A0A815TFY0_9BILA|nr:unnamed protein product [Adineta steineri]CAF3794949.1 unnamed protein product [Adineta steineri]
MKSILISSIYIPPKAKLHLNIFQQLYNINRNCLIVGDLNASLEGMGSRKTNAKGRQLQNLINEGFISCIKDDSTTFEKNAYEEKLDWILASEPLLSLISNVETHPTLGILNGHKPLTFDIQIGTEPKPISARISLNFKAANWIEYRNKLDKQLMLWDMNRLLNSSLDTEEYTTFITNSITEATKETIPSSKQINTNIRLSEATKRLIKLKHKNYRRWKKTGEDSDKHQYYNSKLLLTNSLRNDKKDNFHHLTSSLCNKKMYSVSVWRTVRTFHNKRTKQTYSKTMKYNNITAVSDKEKAELFADYFQNEVYFKPSDTLPFHAQITRETNKIMNGINTTVNNSNNKWQEITEQEV